jgi:hypothetical protein
MPACNHLLLTLLDKNTQGVAQTKGAAPPEIKFLKGTTKHHEETTQYHLCPA